MKSRQFAVVTMAQSVPEICLSCVCLCNIQFIDIGQFVFILCIISFMYVYLYCLDFSFLFLIKGIYIKKTRQFTYFMDIVSYLVCLKHSSDSNFMECVNRLTSCLTHKIYLHQTMENGT